MTKSSVNFKAVKSASHAVSHASRSVEPTYLLPEGKSLGTICLLDDRGNVASVIEAKMALASRQALRQGDYSPVWEGVINLPRPGVGCDVSQYKRDCKSIISEWCQSYQKMTGHTVLRADIHLDEGHVVDGETLLNAHAHVICDKTNEKGRVIKINAPELRKIQDMTAKVTGLDRGESSLKTGRKHIDHQAYKYLAERGRLETQQQVSDLKVIHEKELDKPKSDLVRLQKLSKQWSDADLEKVKNLQAKLDDEPARLAAALAAQEEKYRLDRERMKQENADALAAGLAKMYSQKDYQDLKKAKDEKIATLEKDHAEQVEGLKTKLAEVQQQAAKVPKLETDAVQAQAQITQLTPLAALVPDLKKGLAEAQTEAAKVPGLVAQIDRLTPLAAQVPDLKTKLAEAQSMAGEVPGLVAQATAQKAQIDKLTPLAEQVPALLGKLETAQAKANEVPGLVATITSQADKITAQAEAFDKLKTEAMDIITPLRTEVKTMTTKITELEAANPPSPSTRGGATSLPTSGAGIQNMRERLQEASKQATEAPKAPSHPIAPPSPEKSLQEALKASWDAFVDWIKGVGGVHIAPTENGLTRGAILQMDSVHCIQKSGRENYTIHLLDKLDLVPDMNNKDTTVQYRGGIGHVGGNGLEQNPRPRMR